MKAKIKQRIFYNPDNTVLIGDGGYIASFEDFQADCKKTGFKNPFIKGDFLYYQQGEGTSTVNEEGHMSKPDKKYRPDIEIFLDQLSEFKEVKNIRVKKEKASRPNAVKRRFSKNEGGYGTLNEQLDMLVNEGLEVLKIHRTNVDKNFPIEA